MSLTVFSMVFTAALLHAIWNAMVKWQGDRVVIMALILISQFLVALFLLPFVALPTGEVWWYIGASIVLHNGYYLFLVMAYRYGDLSHVYPIARGVAPLLVAVVSVVIVGEVLSRQAELSVLLITLGVMSLAMTRGAGGLREPKAVILALGTGAFIAAYTVVDGLGARLAPSAHGYTIWLVALDGIPFTVLAICLRKREFLSQARSHWFRGFLAGMASLAAYWIVIWAMTLAPLALVSALRETGIVFAVLFGTWFLKERLDLIRWLSVTATLVGTVALKTSK